jgi:hypothetical protein
MRVNVYAEEMTGKVGFVTKTIDGIEYVGVRFWLYLPVTVRDSKVGGPDEVQGPFMHRDGDDDSSAVTFWGKRTLQGNAERSGAHARNSSRRDNGHGLKSWTE